MVWTGIAFSAFATFLFYLATVRNANAAHRYAGEFCELYLLKHMLPDGHPFEFMFKGLPRNQDHPRLLWPCVATLVLIGLEIVLFVVAIILSAKGFLRSETADTVCFIISLGLPFGVMLIFMSVASAQNHVCLKKMERSDSLNMFILRAEIEKKWPGFFIYYN